jgi:hypothetical protein
MNTAPAELLQLLTIAALQPSSVTAETTSSAVSQCAVHIATQGERKKKKPPCLNRIRQCGLFFSRRFMCILDESASYF